MNERDGMPSELPRPTGAGGSMLRQLREERGLALEGLASMLKVTPAKLDALESGRYHELPDAAFTRALAMTICRVLKVDSAPVLASLPQAQLASLAASEPNQVPFKAKRARLNLDVPAAFPWRELFSARWLVPVAVLLAAVALYFLPQEWMNWRPDLMHGVPVAALAASEPVASSASVPASAGMSSALPATSAVAVSEAAANAASGAEAMSANAASPYEPVYAVEPVASAASSAASTPVTSAGSALVINVTASSWIEVRDASGRRLLSRHVTPGETVGVDGTAPLALKIGNVAGVSMSYKGQSVDLQPYARNNVARLELK